MATHGNPAEARQASAPPSPAMELNQMIRGTLVPTASPMSILEARPE